MQLGTAVAIAVLSEDASRVVGSEDDDKLNAARLRVMLRAMPASRQTCSGFCNMVSPCDCPTLVIVLMLTTGTMASAEFKQHTLPSLNEVQLGDVLAIIEVQGAGGGGGEGGGLGGGEGGGEGGGLGGGDGGGLGGGEGGGEGGGLGGGDNGGGRGKARQVVWAPFT